MGAITHYARVEEIKIEEDGDTLTRTDRLRMLTHHFDEPATVFILSELRELTNPVMSKNGRGVQGTVYTELKQLKESDTIQDL